MKKIIIIVLGVLALLIGGTVGFYFYNLSPVQKQYEKIEFTINSGTGTKEIIDKLADEGLIRNKMVLYIYAYLNNEKSLKAGKYELSPSMSAKDIIHKINKGEVIDESFNLTFVEGLSIKTYASQISKVTGVSAEDILESLNDETYLKELIDKYWFLTDDILTDGIRYPLEGYLFPDTYTFTKDMSVRDIVKVMLDNTNSKLTPLKNAIENSKYSIHEILSFASVVETESGNIADRKMIAGVFYNRLNAGDSLGADVTVMYAYGNLDKDLYNCSSLYNTYAPCNMGKIQIGPIASPGLESIKATLEPVSHDYYYYVSDKSGNIYYTKTYQEHNAKIGELQAAGLWATKK